jgi:hypothetical protein
MPTSGAQLERPALAAFQRGEVLTADVLPLAGLQLPLVDDGTAERLLALNDRGEEHEAASVALAQDDRVGLHHLR